MNGNGYHYPRRVSYVADFAAYGKKGMHGNHRQILSIF
jgi:hypothetical protein